MPVLEVAKLTYNKLKKIDRNRAVVMATLSPIEVHGPHLPLGEDLMTAYALGEATAKVCAKNRPDWNFLILPPVPVASDGVPKLGSIMFPPTVVADVAYYLLRPFAQMGFRRLVFGSFHGGPRHFLALEAAAERLTDAARDVAALSLFSAAIGRMAEGKQFYDAVKDDPNCTITLEELRADHHAGFVETSLALHGWPELVEPSWKKLPASVSHAVEADTPMNDTYLYGYEGRASIVDKIKRGANVVENIARAVRHFKTQTYHGYPGKASARQGKKLFDSVTKMSVELVEEFIERGAAMDVHSPLWKAHAVFGNRPLNWAVDQLIGFGE
jgi:creatinine amidohydrolase